TTWRPTTSLRTTTPKRTRSSASCTRSRHRAGMPIGRRRRWVGGRTGTAATPRRFACSSAQRRTSRVPIIVRGGCTGRRALTMHDQESHERNYAQVVWGASPAIDATLAWIYHQQGQAETGARQFTLLRGAITAMRRAYPQFLAAGGEALPKELLKVIFPIGYGDWIRKHAGPRNLHPYV